MYLITDHLSLLFYLKIYCKNCGLQYVGSTINFRDRVNHYKSEIRNNKNQNDILILHWNKKCKNINDICDNMRFIIIDKIKQHEYKNDNELDIKLFELEKYWQATLCTIWGGLNGQKDWHANSNHRRNFSIEKPL